MSVFLISSLLAAGFSKPDSTRVEFARLTGGASEPPNGNLFEIFKQNHMVSLADHRSHSSHSSHSSHRSGSTGGGHYSHMSHTSHRSSSGGYDPSPSYTPPVYTPPVYSPPAYTPPPSTPSDAGASGGGSQGLFGSSGSTTPSLSGRTKKFASIVRRVQIGLLGQGVYEGPINGIVGPLTRAALRRFQGSHGLKVTGTITAETLDALKVSTD